MLLYPVDMWNIPVSVLIALSSVIIPIIISVGFLYFVIRWMMKVNEKLDMIVNTLDTIANALDTDQKNDT